MSYNPKIKSEAKFIIEMLVARNYDEIVKHTSGIRLPKDEIEYAVDEYGCTIMMPPENVFDNLDIVEVENASLREWSVRCPLWTKEEGHSDLSIELSMIEESEDKLRVELDNIIMF